MHEFVLPILLDEAKSVNIDKQSLVEGAGLGSIDPLPASLTPAQVDIVCGNAVKLSGDELLGLRAGLKLDILSLGILGYAFMSSSKVVDSLRLLLRYSKMLLPSTHISLLEHQHALVLEARAVQLPSDLERFYIDSLFAAIVNNMHILTGHYDTDMHLELMYAAPAEGNLHSEIFGTHVQFNASRYALVFDHQTLQIPITSSNSAAEAIFRRECDRLMRSEKHLGIISEKVKQMLFSARLDFPTCFTIAERLHMSESTLQRRLADEGVRYQELLDQVRHKLAVEYLRHTELPVSEISLLLGYSNPANFRRSFKRWSGFRPSQIRDQRAL